jgi:hypothetical protein
VNGFVRKAGHMWEYERSNQNMKDMVLTTYMNDSVKRLIKDIIKNTLMTPRRRHSDEMQKSKSRA